MVMRSERRENWFSGWWLMKPIQLNKDQFSNQLLIERNSIRLLIAPARAPRDVPDRACLVHEIEFRYNFLACSPEESKIARITLELSLLAERFRGDWIIKTQIAQPFVWLIRRRLPFDCVNKQLRAVVSWGGSRRASGVDKLWPCFDVSWSLGTQDDHLSSAATQGN